MNNVVDLAQYRQAKTRDSPTLREAYRSADDIAIRCERIKQSLMRLQALMDELKYGSN